MKFDKEAARNSLLSQGSMSELKRSEGSIVREFVTQMLIGICYSINLKEEVTVATTAEGRRRLSSQHHKRIQESCRTDSVYKINKENVNFEDKVLDCMDVFEIEFVEYAAEAFYEIRKSEGLSVENLLKW